MIKLNVYDSEAFCIALLISSSPEIGPDVFTEFY